MSCRRSLATLVCPSAPFLIPVRARSILERAVLPAAPTIWNRSYAKRASRPKKPPESASKYLRQVKRSKKYSPGLPYQADNNYEAAHYFRELLGSGQLDSFKEVVQMYGGMVENNSLEPLDTLRIARLLHTYYRRTTEKSTVLPALLEFADALTEDIRAKSIPPHSAASLHLISFFKEARAYSKGAKFWSWLAECDDEYVSAAVYGAAIEMLAYHGEDLVKLEDLYSEALRRFPGTFAEYHLSPAAIVPNRSQHTTLDGLPMTLLQGILTARVLHGDWRNAYLAFDTALRIFPADLPSRFFEILMLERPLSETYKVFLMACRSGIVLQPDRVTAVMHRISRAPLKEKGSPNAAQESLHRFYMRTQRMLNAMQAYIGAGGRLASPHLSVTVGGLTDLLYFLPSTRPEKIDDDVNIHLWAKIRKSVYDLASASGTPIIMSTLNTLINATGAVKRPELLPLVYKDGTDLELQVSAITFRAAIMVAGQCNDLELLKHSWDIAASEAERRGTPLNAQDWQALARAAHHIGKDAFSFVEAQKRLLSHTITEDITRTLNFAVDTKPAKQGNNEKRVLDPEYVQDYIGRLIEKVDEIRDLIVSGKLTDGNRSRMDLFSNLSLGSEEHLRRIYNALTTDPQQPPTAIAEPGDKLPTAVSPTGIPLDELRFQNWVSINELLAEAEGLEKRKEEAVEQAIANRQPLRQGCVDAFTTPEYGRGDMVSEDSVHSQSLEALQEKIHHLRGLTPQPVYSHSVEAESDYAVEA